MMISAASVSPYLAKPARTMRQVCLEIAERDGLPPPDCAHCPVHKECMLMERDRCRRQKRILRRKVAPAPRF